jgi:hypothetical protein
MTELFVAIETNNNNNNNNNKMTSGVDDGDVASDLA